MIGEVQHRRSPQMQLACPKSFRPSEENYGLVVLQQRLPIFHLISRIPIYNVILPFSSDLAILRRRITFCCLEHFRHYLYLRFSRFLIQASTKFRFQGCTNSPRGERRGFTQPWKQTFSVHCTLLWRDVSSISCPLFATESEWLSRCSRGKYISLESIVR